jgi:hypothetical protein
MTLQAMPARPAQGFFLSNGLDGIIWPARLFLRVCGFGGFPTTLYAHELKNAFLEEYSFEAAS